jgi:hypothetical protein
MGDGIVMPHAWQMVRDVRSRRSKAQRGEEYSKFEWIWLARHLHLKILEFGDVRYF